VIMEAQTKIPAIGISLLVTLGNDRQITLQTYVERDDPVDLQNAVVDSMVALAERQKAKAELPELQDELEKHQQTLAQFAEDLSRVRTDHGAAQQRRKVRVQEIDGEQTRIIQEGAQKAQQSGRTGKYEPTGHVKANVDRLAHDKATIAADLEKADAEAALAEQNLAISVKRYEDQIALLTGKIAARKALFENGG